MAFGSVNVPGKLTASDVGAAPVRYDYSGAGTVTDFLLVDLNDPAAEINQTKKFDGKRSDLTYVPPGLGNADDDQIIGLREVQFFFPNRIMVKVTEFYPNPGRVYYNHYNWTEWMGWRTSALWSDASEMGISNPNILHNGNFADPVNQRGRTEYTGEGYTIDRWRHESAAASISLVPGGLRLSGSWDESAHFFSQTIELAPEQLYGKTVTGSMLVNGVLMSGTVQIRDHYDAWDVDWFASNEQVIFYIQMTDTGYFRFFVNYTQDAPQNNVVLNAAKLELGSRQTLAHQDESGNWVLNDPPPDKALELAKCQRYYQTVGVGLMPIVNPAGEVTYSFALPVQMRVAPVVSLLVSAIEFYDSQRGENLIFGDIHAGIIGCAADGAQAILLSGTWENGVAPTAGTVLRHNTPGDIFTFSADL